MPCSGAVAQVISSCGVVFRITVLLRRRGRLLLVNFGRDLHHDPAPEPLLAPPDDHAWTLRWSSDDRAYGGAGTPDLLVARHDADRVTASRHPKLSDHWTLPDQSARVLVPRPFKRS